MLNVKFMCRDYLYCAELMCRDYVLLVATSGPGNTRFLPNNPWSWPSNS